MSAMNIRELCERAKKRRIGHDTEMCDALVDMHARLSPDVVLAVVELLEDLSRYVIARTYPDGPCLEKQEADEIKRILELLNRPKP